MSKFNHLLSLAISCYHRNHIISEEKQFLIVLALFISLKIVIFLPESILSNVRPTSKICQAIDVVRRVMVTQNCKIFDGNVYRLLGRSSCTYHYFSPMKSYLLGLLSNAELADNLISFIPQITSILSEPSCKMVEPLKFDFNYIEVLPKGYFFNIERKCFVKNPRDLVGSPRAFVVYKYTGVVPKPKPFIEGMLVYHNCSLE